MNDDEIKERLESPNNLLNKLVEIRKMPVGRRGGVIPPMVRELVGSISNESEESQTEVAEAFGLTQPSISKSSRGLINNKLDTTLQASVSKSKEKKLETAHDLALDAMVESLTAITSEKLQAVDKPERLARIAESMSRISSNIKGNNDNSSKVAVQVVLFQPNRIKTEDDYETVTA